MKFELYLIIFILIVVIFLDSRIRRVIKFYAKYSYYYLSLTIAAVIGLPLCLRYPCSSKSMWVYCAFTYVITKPLGIEWEFRNDHNLIREGSVIFAANHQNSLDLLGIVRFWRVYSIRCSIVAKNSLFWIWPMGLAMWLSGSKFIKRKSKSEQLKEEFNRIVAELFNDKDKLTVFVEGTRNKNPEILLPFKKGAFVAAIQHQVPIQPLVFSPYYFLDWKNKRFDSGKVKIEILEPISTQHMTLKNLNDLVQKTYDVMSKKNKELRIEVEEMFKNGKTT